MTKPRMELKEGSAPQFVVAAKAVGSGFQKTRRSDDAGAPMRYVP
jgi:hypothetical protein